jgi:predicted MFS family arabinose efflux permease
MLAFGTALGGLVAGGVGIYTAFLVDSFSFFLSAGFIARVGYSMAKREPGRNIKDAFQKYIEGIKYLQAHADVLIIVLHKAAITLTTSGALSVIQVTLGERRFVIGEGGGIAIGIMFAVVGVGTGIGPIVGRRYTRDRPAALRRAIAVGFGLIVLGVTTIASLKNFPIVLLGILFRGIGGGIVWVFSTQLLMQLVPDEVRGRVFATEFALFTLMGAVSAAGTGWAIDSPALGLAGTLWILAGLCVVPAVLWGMCVRKIGRCPFSDQREVTG